jgi:hypothetical protein
MGSGQSNARHLAREAEREACLLVKMQRVWQAHHGAITCMQVLANPKAIVTGCVRSTENREAIVTW